MAEKKLVPVEKFREVALNNGYEVFDEAQVADYTKDAMMKSQAGALSQKDKDEFAVEVAGLMKAICTNEDGSQCTLYYRKPLVDWKIDGNGVVMKGIAGTYTDTPENRKLNRVGQAYVPSPDVIKSIYGGKDGIEEDIVDIEMVEQASSIRKSCAVVAADAERRLALGEIDEELCKSVKTEVGMYLTSWGDTLDECCDVVKSEDLVDVREDLADASAAFADIVKAAHGRYADNAQNRRLHRVGQEYGKAAQEKDKDGKKQGMADGESGEKPSRNGDSVKRDISILEENKDKIVGKYGQEAYDKKIEALKKEGEDFEQKETVKQLKDRADKQDAEEEERRKAEKRAKRQEKRRARHAAKRESAKKVEEEVGAKAEAEEKQEQEPEKKKEQPEQEPKEDGIKLTPKGIKDYVVKNSATPDDRMKAMAEAYKALKDSGESKKVDTFVKEVSTGSPAVDMKTRKYVEAVNNGATHDEAVAFADDCYKEFLAKIQNVQEKVHNEGVSTSAATKMFAAVNKWFNAQKFEKKAISGAGAEKVSSKVEKQPVKENNEKQDKPISRVTFADVPRSKEVNLKKYLTDSRRKQVDYLMKAAEVMPKSTVKQMYDAAVKKFNDNFDSLKKSERASALYVIMKYKDLMNKAKDS